MALRCNLRMKSTRLGQKKAEYWSRGRRMGVGPGGGGSRLVRH